MPLVDFPAGAGGADSRHSNAQPYGYMYLCPQHGCEEYKGCALVNFCGMLQCASLNRGTGRKNTHTKKKQQNLSTVHCTTDTDICGNSDRHSCEKLQNNYACVISSSEALSSMQVNRTACTS